MQAIVAMTDRNTNQLPLDVDAQIRHHAPAEFVEGHTVPESHVGYNGVDIEHELEQASTPTAGEREEEDVDGDPRHDDVSQPVEEPRAPSTTESGADYSPEETLFQK